MVKCFINNKEYIFEEDYTIIQACLKSGIELPRFCYHEKLSIAGSCRMCLVEVEKSPKPVAACAMTLVNDMKVFTKTNLVKRARENVLEFLLANHPLDCPICDQGGECDLQDQAMLFGGDRGRFFEFKRATSNKYCGPLVKTVMTRCIHCTRCVRFLKEIAGTSVFGTTGRGVATEISTYIDNSIVSELSGNLVDICPVGALTAKPYAFNARPWELTSFNAVDVLDSLGSNIRLDFRGNNILRVLPVLNNNLNEDWITDKVRYVYDGLKTHRLDYPMIRNSSGKLIKVSWFKVFKYLKSNVDFSKINYVLGNLLDAESIILLKRFSSTFGSNSLHSSYTFNLMNRGFNSFNLHHNNDFSFSFLFGNSVESLDNTDLCLLINVNLRLESPLLNTRLRRNFLKNNLLILNIGSNFDLNYYYKKIGISLEDLVKIAEGRHWACKLLSKSKKPLVLFNQDILNRNDSVGIFNVLHALELRLNNPNNNNWNVVNCISTFTGNLNSAELGANAGLNLLNKLDCKLLRKDFIFSLSADELNISNNSFLIYQGHHGDIAAKKASIVLPGLSFVEKSAHYLNFNGLCQFTKAVSFLEKANVRNDWKIIINLAFFLLNTVKFAFNDISLDNLFNLRAQLLKHSAKFLINNNKLGTDNVFKVSILENSFLIKNRLYNTFLNYSFFDYFHLDFISRSSKVLALARNNQRKYLFNFFNK